MIHFKIQNKMNQIDNKYQNGIKKMKNQMRNWMTLLVYQMNLKYQQINKHKKLIFEINQSMMHEKKLIKLIKNQKNKIMILLKYYEHIEHLIKCVWIVVYVWYQQD